MVMEAFDLVDSFARKRLIESAKVGASEVDLLVEA
jgi:hypothetical protein